MLYIYIWAWIRNLPAVVVVDDIAGGDGGSLQLSGLYLAITVGLVVWSGTITAVHNTDTNEAEGL